MHSTAFAILLGIALPAAAEAQHGQGEDRGFLVPTFHCMGVYWSPPEGGAEHKVLVDYRPSGHQYWRMGFPLRYHPVDTLEC
jgi:hypothetical protein